MIATQIAGLFRILIAAALGALVAKGLLSEEQAGQIADSILAILGIVALAGWSWFSNKLTTMISHIAAAKEVKKVVTTPEIATADPSPKVVTEDIVQ